MYKEHCILIGKIGKTIGHNGHLALHLQHNLPEFSQEVTFLHLDLGPGELVPFSVEELSGLHGSVRVKFNLANGVEEAAILVGKEVYLSKEEVLNTDTPLIDYTTVIGWDLLTLSKEPIGVLTEIITMPGQDLFSVQGKEKNHLIPIHEDFMVEINEKEQFIILDLPEGLLEINA
ncbi:MAG: hypothetical protein CSA95_00250 [Bacteroidetes bacterium]|nr:MAG: hypothetical protein CSA95_00250 [Bacteroidota bacterium]